MRSVKGSIWAFSKPLDFVVVPVPIGWRKDGTAVLQSGVARQAAERYGDLELYYGDYCLRHSPNVRVSIYRPKAAASRNLIMFPIRPLNELHPQMSWNQKPSLALIERSAKELDVAISTGQVRAKSNVFLPLIGCAEGELEESTVMPVLEEHLGKFSNVWLVRPKREKNRQKAEAPRAKPVLEPQVAVVQVASQPQHEDHHQDEPQRRPARVAPGAERAEQRGQREHDQQSDQHHAAPVSTTLKTVS